MTVQTSSEDTTHRPRPIRLLVGSPLVLGPELAWKGSAGGA